MFFGGFRGRPTQWKWLRQRHVTADVIFADGSVLISPAVVLEMKFQMLFGGFRGRPTRRRWLRQCQVTADVIWAAAKPDVLQSPVVWELEAKFQMFVEEFHGRPTQGIWFRPCHVTADIICTITFVIFVYLSVCLSVAPGVRIG
jgi:hypothetical protein